MDGSQDAVFLLRADELVELARAPFQLEDQFQAELADHPQLLGGSQFGGGKPRRWLLVAREVPVPEKEDGGGRWSLDHLFVDQDAIPTLVEVKRGRDTRLRREVVGQMLDYAANGSRYWPSGFLRSWWERSLEFGADPDEEIRSFAQSEAEAFWAEVEDNLRIGRVRMLFVSDEIPTELQTIIEYLNEQMENAEVLGVSIARYEGDGLSVLVPRVVGSSARLQQSKHGGLGKSYEEYVSEGGEATVEFERRLLTLAGDHRLELRRTPKALQLLNRTGSQNVLQFYPGFGTVQLSLDPVRKRGHDELADEAVRTASEIAGHQLTEKYPGIPVEDALMNWGKLEAIALRLANVDAVDV